MTSVTLLSKLQSCNLNDTIINWISDFFAWQEIQRNYPTGLSQLTRTHLKQIGKFLIGRIFELNWMKPEVVVKYRVWYVIIIPLLTYHMCNRAGYWGFGSCACEIRLLLYSTFCSTCSGDIRGSERRSSDNFSGTMVVAMPPPLGAAIHSVWRRRIKKVYLPLQQPISIDLQSNWRMIFLKTECQLLPLSPLPVQWKWQLR